MDAAEEFFAAMDGRREEPTLRHLSGTIRFELARDGTMQSWMVSIRDGDVEVSRRKGKADCTARMEYGLFEALARGEANAIAATLRGDVEIEGQPAILLAFQRLFPGPPADRRELREKIGATNDR